MFYSMRCLKYIYGREQQMEKLCILEIAAIFPYSRGASKVFECILCILFEVQLGNLEMTGILVIQYFIQE